MFEILQTFRKCPLLFLLFVFSKNDDKILTNRQKYVIIIIDNEIRRKDLHEETD